MHLKKTLLQLIFIFISFSLLGQEEVANHFIVGGSFSIFNSDVENKSANTTIYQVRKNLYISTGIYVAKELSEKWALGLRASYYFERNLSHWEGSSSDNVNKNNEISYSAGFFTRFRFNPKNNFVFAIEPYINYREQNNTRFVDEVENRKILRNSVEIGTSPIIIYKLSDRFNLRLRMGALYYRNGNTTEKGTDYKSKFNQFYSSFNISSIVFGAEYIFKNKIQNPKPLSQLNNQLEL